MLCAIKLASAGLGRPTSSRLRQRKSTLTRFRLHGRPVGLSGCLLFIPLSPILGSDFLRLAVTRIVCPVDRRLAVFVFASARQLRIARSRMSPSYFVACARILCLFGHFPPFAQCGHSVTASHHSYSFNGTPFARLVDSFDCSSLIPQFRSKIRSADVLLSLPLTQNKSNQGF